MDDIHARPLHARSSQSLSGTRTANDKIISRARAERDKLREERERLLELSPDIIQIVEGLEAAHQDVIRQFAKYVKQIEYFHVLLPDAIQIKREIDAELERRRIHGVQAEHEEDAVEVMRGLGMNV